MPPWLVSRLFVNWLIILVRKIGNEVQYTRLDDVRVLGWTIITEKNYQFSLLNSFALKICKVCEGYHSLFIASREVSVIFQTLGEVATIVKNLGRGFWNYPNFLCTDCIYTSNFGCMKCIQNLIFKFKMKLCNIHSNPLIYILIV